MNEKRQSGGGDMLTSETGAKRAATLIRRAAGTDRRCSDRSGDAFSSFDRCTDRAGASGYCPRHEEKHAEALGGE